MKKCSIKGCDNPYHARGYCCKHYDAWRNRGSALAPKKVNYPDKQKKRVTKTIKERYWNNVKKKDDGCWIWIGYIQDHTGTAYGRIKYNGGWMRVHRLSYLWEHGKLPKDKHIHHICGNSLCVNPDHLEALDADAHAGRHAGKK